MTPLNMFVDDVALLTMSQPALQANVDIYDKHCRKWRYKLQWPKFQYVVFGKQYNPITSPAIVAPGSTIPIKAPPHPRVG